ncbi:extracellular solute-binding protein [Bradyrhizobium iriomotense]|uniref:ABC transporter substrate-binding protein n=1 Tax=Bradyrhizobium iriomotense TaxID=441950 RepID=A0ABQ6AZI1_9BRAD|nr:extracellular solute-binding protein [Bradyrhizobium iriomotense]GLR87594.1 ABC transporter substrate-binding protein [Bradyrhizobium iriomotense]
MRVLKIVGLRCSLAAIVLGAALMADIAHAHVAVLHVSAAPSIFTKTFRALASAFERENPDVRIDLDVSQFDQPAIMRQTLRMAIFGDLPDVSFQGSNYLRLLADRNLLIPLDRFIKADPAWTSELYSSSVSSSGRIGKMTYGLGTGMSFPIVFYNKSLVSKIQEGAASLPDNWDGVLDVAARIQSENSQVLGIFSVYNSFMFQGMVGCFGGSMMNSDDSRIAFTEDAGQKAMELLRRIGLAGQAKVDMTKSQSRQAFTGARIAILLDSSSSLASFENEVAGRFEIGTAPLPMTGRDASVPTAGITVVMHTTDPARQALAWRFMKFVAGVEGQTVVATTTGYVPANEAAIAQPGSLAAYYAAHPNMQAALRSIARSRGWYAFPGENAGQIDMMIEDRVGEVMRLRQLPVPALDRLAKDITALLPK